MQERNDTETEYKQEILEVKACDVPTLGAIIGVLRFMEILVILCVPALLILLSTGKTDMEIGTLKGTSLIICIALAGILMLVLYEYSIRGYKKIYASRARFTPKSMEHYNGSDTIHLTKMQMAVETLK